MLTAELKDIFTPSTKGKLLVVTVGNSLRSDDGVGIYIAKQIKKCKKNIIILNAESKPENIIHKAVQIKPQKVVIIDAADFGGRAGEIRLIKNTDIQNTSLSTHSFSLNIVARIIEEDTGVKVFFFGRTAKKCSIRRRAFQISQKSSGENNILHKLDVSLFFIRNFSSPDWLISSGQITRVPRSLSTGPITSSGKTGIFGRKIDLPKEVSISIPDILSLSR